MASSNEHRARQRLFRLRARAALFARRLPGELRLQGGLEHGAMAAAAAILAYVPTQAFGLREGFWAAITAIGVLQARIDATFDTARDQFAGAAIGGAIGGTVVALAGSHLWSYALAVVPAVLACWLANVSSAARLAGITVTIVALVPHAGSVGAMVFARVAEVGWGVTVALAVAWCVDRLTRQTRSP